VGVELKIDDSENMGVISKSMFDIYIKSYEYVIKEITDSTGKIPEPYKTLEENLLHSFFDGLEKSKNMNGFDFISEMLSTLILNQALPNANHRTSMYFVGTLLTHNGYAIDTETHANTVREYFLDSKHIMKKAPKNYREKHLALSKTFLENILGSAQSGRLGSILAYSLMNSFIDSSKDLDLV
jgi:prophage maintenance system killer protein